MLQSPKLASPLHHDSFRSRPLPPLMSHCDDTSEYQSAPTSLGDVTSDASAFQSVPVCSEDATSEYLDMGPIRALLPSIHAPESAPSKAEV